MEVTGSHAVQDEESECQFGMECRFDLLSAFLVDIFCIEKMAILTILYF